MARNAAKRFGPGAALATAAALAAGAAEARLCTITVYDSDRGALMDASDQMFQPADQFIVCVSALSDGVVSLWDRMPVGAPVERLAPNPLSEASGRRALPIAAGETLCFGDGSDGYYLQMPVEEGTGVGLMWAVFTDREETHPIEASFSSRRSFSDSFRRYGAGAIDLDEEASPGATQEDECAPRASLAYAYRVR